MRTASSRASVCVSVADDERARLIASLDFDTPELSGGRRQRIVLAPGPSCFARRSNTPVAVSAWLECVALRIAGPMQQPRRAARPPVLVVILILLEIPIVAFGIAPTRTPLAVERAKA